MDNFEASMSVHSIVSDDRPESMVQFVMTHGPGGGHGLAEGIGKLASGFNPLTS